MDIPRTWPLSAIGCKAHLLHTTFSDQFGSEGEKEGSVTATCESWVEG